MSNMPLNLSAKYNSPSAFITSRYDYVLKNQKISLRCVIIRIAKYNSTSAFSMLYVYHKTAVGNIFD